MIEMRLLFDEQRPAWRGSGPRPVRIHLWRPSSAATGPLPLVMLTHGSGGATSDLAWLGEALSSRGHLVAGIDHHGNNRRDGLLLEGGAFWWERARDLTIALDSLEETEGPEGVGGIGVVGYSLGGFTAAALLGARIDPRKFERLLGGEPVLPIPADRPDVVAETAELVATYGRRNVLERAFADYRDPRILAAVLLAPAICPILDDESLRGIRRAVMVRWGDDDQVEVPRDNGRRYASLITGADAASVGEDVGHFEFCGDVESGANVRSAVLADITEFFAGALHSADAEPNRRARVSPAHRAKGLRMFVAVVLPCFNAAETLSAQLEALSRQVWDEQCELLFVDNGSTDDSVRIFESFRAVLPPSRLVMAYDAERGRLGVAASYALAINQSDADAFLFCEADDEVADNWYAVMADALRNHDLVAPALEYTRLNPPELAAADGGQQSAQVGLSVFPSRPDRVYASGCSLGFTRAVIQKIGVPDVAMGAVWDTDFCIRAALAGIELTFIPETRVHYRLRGEAGGRYRQARSWGRGHVALQARYGGASRVRLVLMAVRRLGISVWRFRRVLLRQRTLRRWLWDLGWAVGVASGAVSSHPDPARSSAAGVAPR